MGSYNCSDGLILPILDESKWGSGLRAVLYLAGLLYSFLGIAIAADVFMCAIERITSQTRKIRLSAADAEAGEEDGSDVVLYQEVRVWNPTVANLSLMALGSSAPEILLSCIEIIGNGFKAGSLGPGTIVGSAAFNLLAITAICVASIPSGETRRIQAFKTFCVTAFFSVFAYIWLLIILVGNSPNIVETWEALLTLLFFVVLVVLAYAADRNFWMKKGSGTEKRQTAEDEGKLRDAVENLQLQSGTFDRAKRWHELERDYALRFPHLSPEELAKMIAWRVKQEEPHDRLWYRIRAVKMLSRSQRSEEYWDASARPSQRGMSASASKTGSIATLPGAPSRKLLEFDATLYGVSAASTSVRLRVRRRGRNSRKLVFNYETVPGSAKAGAAYLRRAESLIMEPGESEKSITVELVKGYEWTVGDTFYVRLSTEDEKTEIGAANPAEVQFLDNASAPEVEFKKNHKSVKESAGFVRLPVVRRGNFDARQTLNWETVDITAEAGKDYEGGGGEIEFQTGEMEKYIDIGVIDDMYEEYAETFEVRLEPGKGEASPVKVGRRGRCTVTITCDDGATRYFRQMDQLVPSFINYLTPGGLSWKEQLIRATSVNAGDVESATFLDIVFHIICFPFKAVFAFVPPPGILGGWLTFVVSLALIGVLTAVVGDLAGIFGCLVGLKPDVTAITLVALGTSLPDTFASRLAAVGEPTADNSIGNVTGSNGVNVFLGLGIPWLIAAIYWQSQDKLFHVPAGTLGFSVTLYTVCAILALGLLVARRFVPLFGKAELGGPNAPKFASAAFLLFLWFFYVLLSSLQAYGHISSF